PTINTVLELFCVNPLRTVGGDNVENLAILPLLDNYFARRLSDPDFKCILICTDGCNTNTPIRLVDQIKERLVMRAYEYVETRVNDVEGNQEKTLVFRHKLHHDILAEVLWLQPLFGQPSGDAFD